MAQWIEQSSATTVKMGPFLDSTDANTTEEALAIAQADIRISKNGGNFAQSNNAAGGTHDENGYYGIPLDATDTGTLGTLKVCIHESGALPVWQEFMVVPTNVWDSMFGVDKLQVDATQMAGVTQSLTDLKDFADAGYDPGTNKVQGVVLADTVTTLTGHTAQTGDSFGRIGAAGVGLTDVNTKTITAGAITAAAIATDAVDADALAADALVEIKAQATTALSDIALDHLLSAADGDDVADNSVIGQMTATDGDWSNFVKGDDSLQSLRDRGDAAWTTGAGTGLTSVLTGTAQAGAAGEITLAAGASGTNDLYQGERILLTGGTGAGQSRMIVNYAGATKIADVNVNWVTNPDATTTYEIQAADSHVGFWDNAGVTSGTNGNPWVDVQDIDGDAAAAVNLEADYDGTGYAKANSTVGTVTTLTGHTAQTGDSFARIGAPAGASVSADIADIQGRLPAALAGGKMSSDAVAISGSTNGADRLEQSARTIKEGTAGAGGLTTTTMETDLTEVNDCFNGRRLIFKDDTATAALRLQATAISDYANANGKLTFTAVTVAPAAGDTFVIV